MMLQKELKFAAISGGVAMFGLIFGWVMFPAILKSQLKKEMALSKKTDTRKMWENIPFPFDFKIYFFNYTNPEVVQKGGIPIVKEVGPYHFELWKTKVDIEDHEEDDTVTYKTRDTFYFKPELSEGLTGEEEVTIPHFFMLGIAIAVSREKAPMMHVVERALNGIFDNPPDAFLRIKVLDLLFRGLIINCDRTEFSPMAACALLKIANIKGTRVEANDQIRFSLFGMKNNTVDPHVVTVRRGIKNVQDVGTVVAIDGETVQKPWRDSCKQFEGTDGSVFPPFLKQTERLESFSFDLCRCFKPWFQKKTSYRGIKTNRYVLNIGDLANDPELNCYCEAPDKCPPKGLMEIFSCTNAPLYVSLPHFLDSDPQLLEKVKGLHPDVEQHGMSFDFEPISGTPMAVKQRIQFNIHLLKFDSIKCFKDFNGIMAPLFWLEESVSLNKTFVKMLKHQLFIPKAIVGFIRGTMVTFGILGVIAGVAYHYKEHITKLKERKTKTGKITPEEDEEPQKDISIIGQAQEPAKIDM